MFCHSKWSNHVKIFSTFPTSVRPPCEPHTDQKRTCSKRRAKKDCATTIRHHQPNHCLVVEPSMPRYAKTTCDPDFGGFKSLGWVIDTHSQCKCGDLALEASWCEFPCIKMFGNGKMMTLVGMVDTKATKNNIRTSGIEFTQIMSTFDKSCL